MVEVERELKCAKEEHEQLCQCFKQTTVELVEQCEQVRGLERNRAELERERSQVDTKLKIEIAKSEVCCGTIVLNNRVIFNSFPIPILSCREWNY